MSQFLRLLPYHHVNIFSATPTPELPPRPVSLEDVSYSDLDQHKSDINSAKVPSSPKHQVTPPPLPNHVSETIMSEEIKNKTHYWGDTAF